MLTQVSHNKERHLKVVKRSNNNDPTIIYEYQVHDTQDTLNPLRKSFSTKAEADEYAGLTLKKNPGA
ncbi:hypothetical protein LCGC14_2764080 [marine sediment metagenome]|uniref:Uncharacterized protein n=1 Tax=marine sediment metagenome TaxID=412755 RepID=A0A0F9B6T4_9ZZZZ